MTVQPNIASIKGPFIALATESRDDIFLTIGKVTKREKNALEILIKNGSYPALLQVGEDALLVAPKVEAGDLRYEGMPAWRFCLEWQGKFPKGVSDLADMQAHVAAEIADGRGCAIVEAPMSEPVA